MDSKGQAFSVFKLLIAAIVAVAILTILLQILPDPDIGRDPTTVAIEALKTGGPILGTTTTTEEVTFKKDQVLNAKTLANGTGSITESQVCISRGDFLGNASFQELSSGKIITYSGSNQTLRMTVLCDAGDKIVDTANALPGIEGSWLSSCSGCTSSTNTCCLLGLRFTN